jgi:kynureninase
MTFEYSQEFAKKQDQLDPLNSFRDKFHIPKMNGEEVVYLTGNSLGLQPKNAETYINQELEDWKNLGVEGHFHAKRPWMPYHEFFSESLAKLVGAQPEEVVAMGSLTNNLHLLMVSFYRPAGKRNKIICEAKAFPSDQYALASQARFHGFEASDVIVEIAPRAGEHIIRKEAILAKIEEVGDELALLMIGGVNYYTGQVHDMKTITAAAKKVGAFVGWDLAHAMGNVEVNLHDWDIDFAAWCTYKYLNSGPGSLAGLFVHEKHANSKNLNRFAGWWNHNKETRFNMRQPFDVIPGAEGWQLSNPPILSMAAIKASLDMFKEVGMDAIRRKSEKLTGYFEFLINEFENDKIKVITPTNPKERGCQLSIQIKDADKKLHQKLTHVNIITDWREPDVIRCAPVPLYNTFQDVYHMVEKLKMILNA